jgi:hypothetical protein
MHFGTGLALAICLIVSPLVAVPLALGLAPTTDLTASLSRSSRFLIIGDSLIEGGIGTELEKRLLNNNVRLVHRQGKQSTGLLHPERLDWYQEIDKIFANQTYDVVIVMFGLNDLANINTSQGKLILGTPEWQTAYAEKVRHMLDKIFRQGKAKKVVWLGAPIAPDNYKYRQINNTNIQMINNLYRRVLAKYDNAIFIDTYTVYSWQGRWTPVMPDSQGVWQRVRTRDGIHITYAGGKMMTDIVIKVLQEHQIELQ